MGRLVGASVALHHPGGGLLEPRRARPISRAGLADRRGPHRHPLASRVARRVALVDLSCGGPGDGPQRPWPGDPRRGGRDPRLLRVRDARACNSSYIQLLFTYLVAFLLRGGRSISCAGDPVQPDGLLRVLGDPEGGNARAAAGPHAPEHPGAWRWGPVALGADPTEPRPARRAGLAACRRSSSSPRPPSARASGRPGPGGRR